MIQDPSARVMTFPTGFIIYNIKTIKMKVSGYIVLAFLCVFSFSACDDDSVSGKVTDNFDRSSMLTSWVDNFILPYYAEFIQASEALTAAAVDLQATPDADRLSALREAHVVAYRKWQTISLYQIGLAESIGLREKINAYPTNVDGVEAGISSGEYNLELSSQRDRQGFPALDYLLYGSAADDAAILNRLVNEAVMRNYIVDAARRIETLTKEVNQQWIDSFRAEFIASDGGGATASVDRMINDYIFYYEKWLRAGKVGIPAGVFSGSPDSKLVEARFNGEISRTLLLEALQTTQDFFNGDGADGMTSFGLADYLNFLGTEKNGERLSQLINNQLNSARTAIEALDQDFATQINNDNIAFLEAYDELQKVVVLIKVDMLQAFNVAVDFVDADGD